jgi:glycine/D-amino acid oxidase-like deaminating enzyme
VATIALTVFFEDPFWVGVVERQADGALQAARHVFGAEPSPGEVLEFVQKQLVPLLDRPSVAVGIAPPAARALNPKRAARAAARALAEGGVSTQSQEALRLQIEQRKQVRRQYGKAEREAEAARKRQLKLQKAKARHRGR